MRRLAIPATAEPWSLTSLCEKFIKIGAKVVSHGRYLTFQMTEVAVPRQMFADILMLIARLRAPPALHRCGRNSLPSTAESQTIAPRVAGNPGNVGYLTPP